MLPIADGSDLGGSIRNPASFNNVVGLRPTPGLVPDRVDGDVWDVLSVVGPMARTVGDVALMLTAIAGADARAPLSYGDPDEFSGELAGAIAGLRVGWCRDVGGLPVEPAVAAVMARARARFVELGAVVEDVALDLEAADLAFETLRALGYARLAHEAPELLGVVKDTVRWNIERGFELDGETVARAIAARGEVFATVAAACSRFDVLAAPAAQVVPFPIEVEFPTNVAGVEMPHYIGWMRACSRISVSSHPVAAVPAGFTGDGLPVGLQLVGRRAGDRRLLEHAAAWEAATGFTGRRPG
jgi:amidase